MADAVQSYRKAMTPDQLDVLDAIWSHHLSTPHGEWPPKRDIHLSGPDRSKVRAAIEALPPGSWFEQTGNTPRYGLTFLGALLTRRGEEVEILAVRYLGYMRDELRKRRSLSQLTAAEIADHLVLDPEQVDVLGRVIQLGNFIGDHFRGGPAWEAGIPDNADELVDVPDLRQYVRDRAMERAAHLLARQAPEPSRQPSEKQRRGDFWFVEDVALRKQLAADRQELYAVHGTRAWKSSVILAGGLIEGMLLDVLGRRTEEAKAAYARLWNRSAPALDRWGLAELVDVGSELGLLRKDTVRLSHALREFRDLVHPGRQLREGIHLTKDEADIAVSVVNICFRALAEAESQ